MDIDIADAKAMETVGFDEAQNLVVGRGHGARPNASSPITKG